MRTLVTGGTGFVGSHTALALLSSGHEVQLLVRDPKKAERVFAAHGVACPPCVEGDIADPGAVDAALDGCESVVHAAAVVALEAARAREVLDTNARGVENVVGGALRRGVRSVVYVSSIGALFRPGGPPITSDAPVAGGRNAYARSKADAEIAVRRLQDDGAPIHITYPTAVIGPDDPGLSEANRAVRTFLRDTMLMTSSGFQSVDVRDVAEVQRRLVEREGPGGRFVVGGHYHPWRELADLIDGLTGGRVRRLPGPVGLLAVLGRLGDAVKRVYDFEFPLTSESIDFATRWTFADSSRTLETLGVAFRDPRTTYRDTLRWLAEAGHVEPRHVGRVLEAAASGA